MVKPNFQQQREKLMNQQNVVRGGGQSWSRTATTRLAAGLVNSASVLRSAFRKTGPSMSVTSASSVELEHEMERRRPRPPPLQMATSVDTIYSAIRTHNYGVLLEIVRRICDKADSFPMAERSAYLASELEAAEPEYGIRPLHLAAEVDNVDASRLLISRSANPLAPETRFYRRNAVHIAAACGSLDVLTYYVTEIREMATALAQSSAATDFSSSRTSEQGDRSSDSATSQTVWVQLLTVMDGQGLTPLHWAVNRNKPACIRFLLEQGASLIPFPPFGPCVIQTASAQGSLPLLELIAQVSPDEFQHTLTKDLSRDHDGFTPLHHAALLDDTELIHFLILNGSPVDALDDQGRTPFDLSVRRGCWRTAGVLLDHGAEPFHQKAPDGRTAVHHAALAGQNVAECDVFVDLLRTHAYLAPFINALDEHGHTALHYGVLADDRAVVQGLVEELGADVTVPGRKNKTVLHYAAKKHGSLEVMEFLLRFAPRPAEAMRSVDQNGQTPLHIAAEHGQHDTAEFLIKKGALSFPDDFGRTTLHLAAAKNHETILQLLLDNNNNLLNQTDIEGKTALHIAAVNDAARAVTFLLAQGAASTIDQPVDHELPRRTPLELAIAHKSEAAAMAFVNSIEWRHLVSQRSREYGTVALGLVEYLPQVMKVCLDRCVMTEVDNETRESYVKYDFFIVQPSLSLQSDEAETSTPESDTPSDAARIQKPTEEEPMVMLKAMSHKKRSELLSHPVCRTILEQKWIIYGLYCSLAILVANIIFVVILSVILIESVEKELLPHLKQISYNNVRKHQPSALNYTDIKKLHQGSEEANPGGYDGTALSIVLIFALLLILAKEIVDFTAEGRRYFWDWTNYIQIVLFFVGFAFIICLYEDSTFNRVGPYTYQFGPIAVFLAWINLLRFCRPFGTFGIYSFMFFTIFKTLVQVATFFFILTCAFTVSFFTVFQTFIYPDNADYYDKEPMDTADLDTTFQYLDTAGMRIASLMLGDLEAVERFLTPFANGMLPYPFLAFCFYGLCLIMMPILLNNLLMGLSLGDLTAVRRNAVVLRLRMQISLHERLEKLFPVAWLRRIYKKTDEYRYYPKRKVAFRTWLARWTSGETAPIMLAESSNQEEEIANAAAREKNELALLRRKIQDIDGNMAEIRQLLIQTIHNLDTRHVHPLNASNMSASRTTLA